MPGFKIYTEKTQIGFLDRSHKPLMWAVAVSILAFAPVARSVQNFLRTHLESEGISLFVLAIFLAGGVIFIFISGFRKLPRKNIILTVTVFLSGLLSSFYLRLPEERIHLIQFGLLGLLACPSLKGREDSGWTWSWKPLLFVVLIGTADEVLQWFLPDRFFDTRDILFNALGGIWGIMLYLAVRGTRTE